MMGELHEAASTGNLGHLEDQLSKGLNPNEPDPEWGGRTPLHIASSLGHKKCVYVLIQAGADVNAVTETGWTPAHCACETGKVSRSILYMYRLPTELGTSIHCGVRSTLNFGYMQFA